MNDGRAVTGIEYAAYEAMADASSRRSPTRPSRGSAGARVAIVHRLGTLALGEASVGIAVAHAHRARRIDASRWVIEELKRRVPIWKREHYADGTREWVDPSGGAPRDA